MCALSRRVVVTSRCGRRIFGSQANDLPEKGGGRGIQYGVAAAIVSAGPVGGRERAGGADGVPAGVARVHVAVPGCFVRAGRRGADRRASAVAAVFKPGAGVPPRSRHGLPGAGGGPDRWGGAAGPARPLPAPAPPPPFPPPPPPLPP